METGSLLMKQTAAVNLYDNNSKYYGLLLKVADDAFQSCIYNLMERRDIFDRF